MTAFRVPLAACLPVLIAFAAPAFAHRLDEYLQATLVDVTPTPIHLQINLTPGVAVADRVLAEIDRDADGAISAAEAAAYADSLRRDLTVRLDGQPVTLALCASSFPDPAELREGTGIIQLEFAVTAAPPLAPGPHRLAIDDRHLPSISVYLLNAALPSSGDIRITAQHRNDNQSAGEIDFTLRGPAAPPPPEPIRPSAVVTVAALAALLLAALSATAWRVRRRWARPA
jgi:hypothetical protein